MINNQPGEYPMTTLEIIKIATNHAHKNDSAMVCLNDAVALHKKGDDVHAKQRAIKSLAYSVGVCDPIYLMVNK